MGVTDPRAGSWVRRYHTINAGVRSGHPHNLAPGVPTPAASSDIER